MSSLTYIRDAKNFVIAVVVKSLDGEIVYPLRYHSREKLLKILGVKPRGIVRVR